MKVRELIKLLSQENPENEVRYFIQKAPGSGTMAPIGYIEKMDKIPQWTILTYNPGW